MDVLKVLIVLLFIVGTTVSSNVCSDNTGCENGGTCTNGVCQCTEGFQGPTCNQVKCDNETETCDVPNIKYCAKVDKGGTPTDTCFCKDDFWGPQCSKKTQCAENNQLCNAGKCSSDENGVATCDCTGTNKVGDKCQFDPCPDVGAAGCVAENIKYCYQDASKANICVCKDTHVGAKCDKMVCTDASKCKNSATCEKKDGADTCMCAGHWKGATCEEATECGNGPKNPYCQNGGECITKQPEGTVSCKCQNTHTGPTCTVAACTAAQKAKCDSNGTDYCEKFTDVKHKCHCHPTHTGEDCSIATKCSDKEDPFCKNNGRCSSVGGKDECACINGFHGDNCEKAQEECADANYCLNNGTCKRVDGVGKCTCTGGFTGKQCKMGPCKGESPCQNHGVCYTLAADPNTNKCECLSGFKGETCTADVDECTELTEACKNGGRCTDKENGFNCSCADGFSGPTCEEGNPCKLDSNYCNGKGDCVENKMKASCTCKNGYTGPRCEKDPCFPKPCGANGICEVGNAAPFYTCTCKSGWEGPTCETDIDECAKNNPCANGGKCTNAPPGDFSCACQVGFTGKTCSDDIDECTIDDTELKHKCDSLADCANVKKAAGNMGYTCTCRDSKIGNGMVGRCHDYKMLDLGVSATPMSNAEAHINLDFGIPFGVGKIEKNIDVSLRRKIRISKNGFISVDWKGDGMILDENAAQSLKICAAYMTPLHGGTVKYISHTKLTADSTVFDGVKNKILPMLGGSNSAFDMQYILIVEWRDVKPEATSTTEKATFQIYLVSDTKKTFCVVHHQPGGNYWTKNTDSRKIFMGVSNGATVVSLPGSLSDTATDIDIADGIDGLKGVFVNTMGTISGDTNNEYDCAKWNKDNTANKITAYTNCPYTYEQMKQFGTFKTDAETSGCKIQKFATGGIKYRCCYAVTTTDGKENGPLIKTYPEAGLMDVDGRDALEMKKAKEACCLKSDLCKHFSEICPVSTYESYKTPSFEASVGDPHISTLDGKAYTFNGKGEYTLLKTKDSVTDTSRQLEAQCQTKSPSSDDSVKATIFSGFAFAGTTSSTVEVKLSTDYSKMEIRVKETPSADASTAASWTTKDFATISADGEDFTQVSISKSSDSEITISFANGFQFKVGLGVKMLTITVMAPVSYNGKVEGLMGNYNKDDADEFIARGGTTPISGTTERDIFNNFAKTWKVQSKTDSLFYHPTDSSFVGHDDTFEPHFLDEYTSETKWKELLGDMYEQANTACLKGGTSDTQIYKLCMFDIGLTKDISIGESSSSASATATAKKAMMENTPPTFDASVGKLEFKVGEEKQIPIKISDKDAGNLLSVIFSGTAPPGAELLNNENIVHDEATNHAELKWTPTDKTPHKFELIAKDDKGGEVTKLLQVRLDHCVHGTASFSHLDSDPPSNSENFYLAVCTCTNDYVGDSCDLNPCEVSPPPCFTGVDCTFPKVNNKLCGDCPTGYTGNGVTCTDNDECATNKGGCEFNCRNTAGSFECTCSTGMQVDPENKLKCIDLDECESGAHNCDDSPGQKCENTAGSFRCVCKEGYTDNGGTCVDIDECATNVHNCDKNAACKNTLGSFECTCNDGFSGIGTVCADIDECLNPNLHDCEQKCINVDDGSRKFRCECDEGYLLNTDDKTCKVNPNNICQEGHGCEGSCARVNDQNVCSCPKGKKLADNGKNCQGLDLQQDLCPPLGCEQECVDDGSGGPVCACRQGFKLALNRIKCEDLDECTDLIDGKAQHNCAPAPEATCTNKANGAGFSCACNEGYIGNGTICSDYDECQDKFCHANADCINQPGKPANQADSCQCKPTFVGDGLTCTKAGKSLNLAISFISQRYEPEFSDINSEKSKTFIKKIKPGLEASMQKKYGNKFKGLTIYGLRKGSTVADVNSNFESGTPVEQGDLKDGVGMTETGGKCFIANIEVDCQVGVADFDECAAGPSIHNCPEETQCSNTQGSYKCVCKPNGFIKTGEITKDSVVIEQCKDIDECVTMCKRPGTVCTNLKGTYACDCPENQWSTDANTEDCKAVCDPNPCEQGGKCTYSKLAQGGFNCTCPEHYTGKTCDVVDPQYADMRTTAIAIGVVFGLLIVFLLIVLVFLCKKRRHSQSAAWTVQGDKYRRKGSQPLNKGPLNLDDYESGSIPRAKRDTDRQQYEMSENSPRGGTDNPAFQTEVKPRKQDGSYQNEYF